MNGRPITTLPEIEYIEMIIDSTGDRGTSYREKFLGLPIMRYLAGLAGKSPEGSFTNGLPWSDYVLAAIANEFIIKRFQKHMHLRTDDISDADITHDQKMQDAIDDYYTLKDDKKVTYRGKNFARTYAQGGLSSHSYRWEPTANIKLFFARLVLPTLEEKRADLLKYDEQHHLSDSVKEKTLYIDWYGANDLVTVNTRATKDEVDKAIEERVKNLEILIANGYRHFYLFNLPNLAYTPRYQNNTPEERENANKWSLYYNEQLKAACLDLKIKYMVFPKCNIDIYDVNALFMDMYEHPEKYHLDKSKLKTPYLTSPDFKMLVNGTSPAKGEAFYDWMHPSAILQAQLALPFLEKSKSQYTFAPPKPVHHSKRLRRTESVPDLQQHATKASEHERKKASAELKKDSVRLFSKKPSREIIEKTHQQLTRGNKR